MGRGDPELTGYSKLIQYVSGLFHDLSVTEASHDNAHPGRSAWFSGRPPDVSKGFLADIFSVVHPFPGNFFYCLIGQVYCLLNCIPKGRNPKDPSARGDEFVSLPNSSCVKDHYVFHAGHVFKAVDDFAGLIASGITSGGQYNADSRPRIPFKLYFLQSTFNGCVKYVHEVCAQAHKDGLGLRITKPTVKFQDLRAIMLDHETAIEHSLIGPVCPGHGIHSGLHDRVHDVVKKGCTHYRGRRVSPHAARVRSLVIIKYWFMVLRCGKGKDRCPIGYCHK